MKRLKDMTEVEVRTWTSQAMRRLAIDLTQVLSADDAWRLMMTGSLWVLLDELGDEGAAATLRELADRIEESKPN